MGPYATDRIRWQPFPGLLTTDYHEMVMIPSASASADVLAFERHARDIYGWAFRILGRHHDALDVVQDVFLKWQRQCREDTPGSARGWLRTVTINRAIDLRRRDARYLSAGGDTSDRFMEGQRLLGRGNPGTDTLGSGNPVALSSVMDKPGAENAESDNALLRGDIQAALARLTDMQRGTLVAKVYDDMTFAQIAQEFGTSVSTIKTHYLRAIGVLRTRLEHRWCRG